MATLESSFQKIKALAMDVDGCLTDGRIIYGDKNVELKCFDVKDGLGVAIAHNAGLVTAIITGRTSQAVARRARELKINNVFQGFHGKLAAWEEFKKRHDLRDEEIAYLGDDLLDLVLLKRAGVSFAPADADAEVKSRVDVILEKGGGNGALRETIERILKGQGRWESILEKYCAE
jgi:3-deoxy-D-manno-octulosonate 8-phosphate phosphatase (KDO 8-P phosphatase)